MYNIILDHFCRLLYASFAVCYCFTIYSLLVCSNHFAKYVSFSFRNNSIACLRAKAQEHQARLLNSGLLLQVRSLAGLQNPLHHPSSGGAGNGGGVGLPSPHHSDTNGNNLLLANYHHHHSPTQEIDRQRSEANSSNGSAISITGWH